MAIFWLVPMLFLNFYCGNWPTRFSRPVNVALRTAITIVAGVALYVVYYKTAHLFLGVQKGYSHPQQFPMIPTIWFINIMLINMWFMDGWPGWKAVPKTEAELSAMHEEVVAHDVKWSPALGYGLAVGVAGGVAFYFLVVAILPWLGQIITIIEGSA
jgi:AAT family amino acid transporter